MSYTYLIHTYLIRGKVALILLGALSLLLSLRGGVGRRLFGLLLAIPLPLLLTTIEFSLGNHLARDLIKVKVFDGLCRIGDAISWRISWRIRRRKRRGAWV